MVRPHIVSYKCPNPAPKSASNQTTIKMVSVTSRFRIQRMDTRIVKWNRYERLGTEGKSSNLIISTPFYNHL